MNNYNDIARYWRMPERPPKPNMELYKIQLVDIARELTMLLLLAGKNVYERCTYNNNDSAVFAGEADELRQLLTWFTLQNHMKDYMAELRELDREELNAQIKFLSNTLTSLKVNHTYIMLQERAQAPDLFPSIGHERLALMLDYAWKYGNETIRNAIGAYLEGHSKIAFDLYDESGYTERMDNELVYHLDHSFEEVASKDELIRGSVVLAHEFMHNPGTNDELEEEVEAVLQTGTMLTRLINEENFVINDENLQTLLELKERFQKEDIRQVLRIINQTDNFPDLLKIIGLSTKAIAKVTGIITDYNVITGPIKLMMRELMSLATGNYELIFGYLKPFMHEEDYNDMVLEYSSSHPWKYIQFRAGVLVGLVPGILKGLWDTIVGLWDLLKLAYKVEIAWLTFHGKHIISPIKSIKEDIEWLKNAGSLVKTVGGAIIEDPSLIAQLFQIAFQFFRDKIREVLSEWSKKSPFFQGYAVGLILGAILFEIIIEVIGTKGLGKLSKLSKTKKFQTLITKVTPILRKLKLDKFLDIAKTVEKVTDNVDELVRAGTKFNDMEIEDMVKYIDADETSAVIKSQRELLEEINEIAAKNLDDVKPPPETVKEALDLSDEAKHVDADYTDEYAIEMIHSYQLAKKQKILDKISDMKTKVEKIEIVVKKGLSDRNNYQALMQYSYEYGDELNKIIELARKSELPEQYLDETLKMADEVFQNLGDQVHKIHQRVLQEFASKHELVIFLRECNPDGFRFMLQKGYIPKPEAIKIKTLKKGKNKGLVAFIDPEKKITDPDLASLQDGVRDFLKGLNNQQLPGIKNYKPDDYIGRYNHYKKYLDKKGFYVDPNDSFLIKKKGTGDKIFGDYDLHGVYDKKTGKHIPIEDKDYWIKLMNEELGISSDMIQHWAHDAWPDRNNRKLAGVNAGPLFEKGVYALLDDDSKLLNVHIEDNIEFVNFFTNYFDKKVLKKTYPSFYRKQMKIIKKTK